MPFPSATGEALSEAELSSFKSAILESVQVGALSEDELSSLESAILESVQAGSAIEEERCCPGTDQR